MEAFVIQKTRNRYQRAIVGREVGRQRIQKNYHQRKS